jgi:hypothetical protein
LELELELLGNRQPPELLWLPDIRRQPVRRSSAECRHAEPMKATADRRRSPEKDNAYDWLEQTPGFPASNSFRKRGELGGR